MHFEILVEDMSGGKMLDILIPRILGDKHTYRIHTYKGIGSIPKGLKPNTDASKRILLDQLPGILRGYGKTYPKFSTNNQTAIIVICDLDARCLKAFRQELLDILHSCNPCPETRFCIAVEEGEAWLLGDIDAIRTAYPKAKETILSSYKNDSICGTWEKLADAIYPGGATKLSAQGWQAVGTEKSKWAENITPYIKLESNASPSFQYFHAKILELSEKE